jgi:hypothetical protein
MNATATYPVDPRLPRMFRLDVHRFLRRLFAR